MTELHNASDSINMIRESNRPSPLFNHLSAVAEGIVALGWFFEPKPADFVSEIVGGIEYYGNKVLKDYKEKWVPKHNSQFTIKANTLQGIAHISSTFRHTIKSSSPLPRTSNNTTRRV